MANGHKLKHLTSLLSLPTAAAVAMLNASSVLAADAPSLDELLAAVVRIKTFIPPDARTVQGLGREREGSGILIDQNGLVLTIGYLMVEAYAAEVTTGTGRTVPATVVGYDHETGFGLLRTIEPIKVKPLSFGKSAQLQDRDPVLIASFGGPAMAAPAFVVSKRVFAGNWEYMLDEAIFTAPPHPAWSGAALLNREGRLVGVGSLIVGDATGKREHFPGNMFVPIDRLPPILGDLIADGKVSGPAAPWLGITTDEANGQLTISRVTTGGPAEKAGLRAGDAIVGVKGRKAATLVELYRLIRAQGDAGTAIGLDVMQGAEIRRVDVMSVNRLDYLKLKTTF